MECFRSSIYSVLMFASRLMRPYSLYCCEDKHRTPAPHVLTGATLDDRFAFTSGTCVAVVNRPVSWETVSFDVLIAQRRYAGRVTRPPCQSQQCGVDFHSYAPGVDELARHAQDANM